MVRVESLEFPQLFVVLFFFSPNSSFRPAKPSALYPEYLLESLGSLARIAALLGTLRLLPCTFRL